MTNSQTETDVKQPSKRKPLWRWIGFALLLVAVLAVVAPYVPADVLRPHIERALERSLNRKVAVQNVRFTFFPSGPVPGPGFALENVTIDEDPRAGIEPFAHMEELGASVRLLSLLQGKLELSGINLGDASINVVQTAAGMWNFQYLLSRTDPGSAAIPAIRMRSGRVNFKFGDTKSVFYFNDADLDIAPSSSDSSYASGMEIRFGGAPARTDHSARDFGRFFVSGTASENYHKLDLNVELEKSSLEETLRLIDPRGFGVHGVVAMDARLSGEPGDLKALGSLQIGDVHRWDLLPAEGGVWKVPFAGTLDLRKEQLNLLSTSKESVQPVSVRVHAQNFLQNPDWEARIDFTKAPLATLFEVANHMGAVSTEISKLVAADASNSSPEAKTPDGTPTPQPTQASTDGLKVEGSVTGSAVYARRTELSGKFKLEDISLSARGGEPVRVPEAVIEMGGGTLQLLPAEVQFGPNQTAELEATSTLATPRTLDLKVSTRGLSVDAIRSLGLPALPFLEPSSAKPPVSEIGTDSNDEKNSAHGTWKGWARYSIRDVLAETGPDLADKGSAASADDAGSPSDTNSTDQNSAGTWTSDAELQNASFAMEGLSEPVQIQYAAIKMDGSRIALSRMRAKAGGVAFTGSYQWNIALPDDSNSLRPQKFNLAVQNADIADLEQLFAPSLARGKGGLLARTLRLGGAPPAPDWLKSRHAEGNVTIENLAAEDWTLHGVKARVVWNGMVARIGGLTANLDPAVLAGDLDIDVAAGSPRYHFAGTLNGVPYHGGVLNLSGAVDSFGAGKQLLLNATADGSAQGRSIAFAPDAEFRTISSNVQLKAAGAGPRWNLTNVEVLPVQASPVPAIQGSTTMTGSGISQDDGRLALELTQGTKQVRYVGVLFASPASAK